MTRARKTLVSLESTPFYHCISRCVRRAWLCGEDPYTGQNFEHRRQWVLDRLQQLSEIFAIDICAYAIMSSHYHVVLHVDREKGNSWSEHEVITRWTQLYKGHLLADRHLAGEVMSGAERAVLSELIEEWRLRLFDVSWFMRCLNEYLARKANEEDRCKGRFFEGRFKSQALLDEGALLTCMSYVDLNPIRASMAATPEESDFTSIQERIRAYIEDQKSDKAKRQRQTAPTKLFPMTRVKRDEPSRGIDFDEKDYFRLVDWTGRAIRDDKRGSIPVELSPILERLQLDPEAWLNSIKSYSRDYFTAVGAIDRIKAYAESLEQRWFQGQSAAANHYRLAIVE
ncbi:MAG: transposase [Candidatus Thiodiazotropha taylori]|nr:transposase [Candidatus Thiodiazotropha taylori]MCG8112495.1 transposase [Candidatus Thiodiazotropha taylori]MCW4280519.1 transposase [Candidatus Thiodiazotropha taylori]MCW4284853.1 transposase [Candidatus Thiodiazotropha taylori]